MEKLVFKIKHPFLFVNMSHTHQQKKIENERGEKSNITLSAT